MWFGKISHTDYSVWAHFSRSDPNFVSGRLNQLEAPDRPIGSTAEITRGAPRGKISQNDVLRGGPADRRGMQLIPSIAEGRPVGRIQLPLSGFGVLIEGQPP